MTEWEKRTGRKLRDPDRAIRKLYQEEHLIKVRKGVYKFDPAARPKAKLAPFTQEQKQAILKRGGYACCVCGITQAEGAELHVDHIRPQERGGTSEIDNGQVLCSQHNMRKKTLNQTEMAKRLFVNFYNQSASSGDEELTTFCREILSVYDKYGINEHIEWK